MTIYSNGSAHFASRNKTKVSNYKSALLSAFDKKRVWNYLILDRRFKDRDRKSVVGLK